MGRLLNGLGRRAEYGMARAHNAVINLATHGSLHAPQPKHPADFLAYTQRLGGRQNSGFPDKWRLDQRFPLANPAKVAVVLHCYYPELLEELYQHLENIPVEFDLFITNASGTEIPLPQNLSLLQHQIVLPVENHGRDIFPLVQLVNAGFLNPYEIILKMHTKKSAWRGDHQELSGTGTQWKDAFLEDLLGSREATENILAAFATDASLGLITAKGNILGKEFWGGDKRIVKNLLRRLELDLEPKKLRFAAGSMYWVRGFVLQGLRSLNLTAADFDKEAGQVDGTTAHAIERIIGILCEEAGLSLNDVSATANISKNISSDIIWQYFQKDQSRQPRVQAIPFYLPQFYPSQHNNRWWGAGFTEWSNVTGAVPAYSGHYQPKLPTDLGFYDLRYDDVREAQTKLAKQSGITGFMYYYYWFAGERLLHTPIENLHASKVNMPFCLMWANENWTRRWDGQEADVLIKQDYEKIPAANFIDDIIEFLLDPRYIRIDGKAVLAVYRPGQMPDFAEIAQEWRERARAKGAGELLILTVNVGKNFDSLEGDLTAQGIDGALDFPPHKLPWAPGPAAKIKLDRRWRGNLMSYPKLAAAAIARNRKLPANEYPGVMVGFDNTARRQWNPEIWYGSNPYTFHRWLKETADVLLSRPPQQRLLFINAWNEWAESAILEPTTRFGNTFLLAVRSVLFS